MYVPSEIYVIDKKYSPNNCNINFILMQEKEGKYEF